MAEGDLNCLESSSGGMMQPTHEEQRRLILRRLRTAAIGIFISALGILVVIVLSLPAGDGSVSSRKQIESKRIFRDSEWEIGNGEIMRVGRHLKKWLSHHAEMIWELGASRVFRVQGPVGDPETWPELRLGWRTVSAVVLGALVAAVCSAVGLGGGFLFVLLWRVLLQFNSKTSAALSTFMIMGGSIVGVGMNLKQDNPNQLNKPLVDFEVAVVLQPNLLLGSTIGVLLNTVFPDWLLAILIVPLFIFASVHTTRTGLKRWRNETRVANAKRIGKRDSLRRANTATEKALAESLLGYYKSISSRYSAKTISILAGVWILVVFLQILRGGRGYKGLLGIEECGLVYWLLTALQVPVAIGVTGWVLYDNYVAARAANAPGVSQLREQNLPAGTKLATFMSGMALLGGLVAGMFGIGGAVIISPLLLSVGIIPEATAATSQLLVFFAASMSAAQYTILGSIPVAYALVAALISAMSGVAGVLGLRKIVHKMKRPSIIVFCIAFVLGFSAILMTVSGSLETWNSFKSGAYMGFNSPC